MEPLVIAFFATWVVVLVIKSQERYPDEPSQGSFPPDDRFPYDQENWRQRGDDRDFYEREDRGFRRESERYLRRGRRHQARHRR